MMGSLALVGGDEFRVGCEMMDEAIITSTGKPIPNVLILPTAAAHENPARAADNGVRHFSALGATASRLMVLNRDDAMDPVMAEQVERADVVYMTGGNPAHLLETLDESLLLRHILNRLETGGVLAGSSAGAMVMGGWMRFRQWRRALGIAGQVAVLPHHERADPETVVGDLGSAPADLAAVLGVDGRSGVLGGLEGWTALGPGRVTVYRNGTWQRFEHGQSFDI